MLDRIILFSIKNKIIVGFFTLILIVWGIWSATKLPIDAIPDITNNQVQIITVTPTLASQEVEQLITFPIEQSIANLPDIEETRSISRFGLSVVTVVFKDKVDIYFARQLISEKLKEAQEDIPAGLGKPEMAPVSTGLGEVYQYIIHPKKGSENKYSSKDLREMQDWIVARHLNGTPGVAEINSFGGELKQYEVAINPDRLIAMNVNISEVFSALEGNNQNTGGAYIEKQPNVFFIRGIGTVNSLDDIGNIMIKNINGVPSFIKDVADVRFGHAVRYGALTYNGEVDAVGGVVMMLKGENSNDVVKRVKEKMLVIQKSLPDDVVIEAYLDRTNLVNRAIHTVEKNLLEGALIVIFILVVFLGNFRAGLIVASVIPLAMLFALSLMNLFGVSANLMSLGAIDFGLIVDGAVIVVEATMHHLGLRKSVHRLTQSEMDDEVFNAASKIRKSAAFGEIIILIVYIPILSLVGIEGKMFRPMAEAVGFAILGALILSLTYVPMMSALFMPKSTNPKASFSDKMMEKFQQIYQPLLEKAIQLKYIIITISIILFSISILLFGRMGGEFIPNLKEGDFAFHCILPQGTSLNQSIETSMQASRIIKQFDEVKMVVGKTGTAEVPTDPMPFEITDLIIVLKPQSEWKNNKTYEDLADEMMEKLEDLPGVFFESSQPIQMRFNELMTGVRQDVAVKIFGENMDTLSAYANRVARVIKNIDGATAPQVERVDGLPQINIEYDRLRLANYGLSIQNINDIVSMAFAGKSSGIVYENERRFDLVVRLDSIHRDNIDNVRNLMIPISSGMQIPLSQVADINYKLAPAQISREAGKRRIVVGFNVKDRDVQSVVEDIQKTLDEQVKLPTGYYYTYGGTFENLQAASKRLMIAVPLALLLIFVLLYFTFHSVKLAVLIFTAIPMSAIGGVIALLIRDMPFSVSAGIGFIALFGVAVLNGIVLIGTFNQLRKEGETDILKIVVEGAKIRLRPVLMTASVASLGFLPMALSSSAGAEVQRPLATVVIGGLITATLLTLFVLPLLYLIFNSKESMRNKIQSKSIVMVLFILFFGFSGSNLYAQAERKSLDELLQLSSNNLQYQINKTQKTQSAAAIKGVQRINKTGVFIENEDIRPSDRIGIWKVGLSQDIPWPGVYRSQKKLAQEQSKLFDVGEHLISAELKRDITASYYEMWYVQDKMKLYEKMDSIYSTLHLATKLKVKTGDSPGLDSVFSKIKMNENFVLLKQLNQDIAKVQKQLMLELNTDQVYLPENKPLSKIELSFDNTGLHPELQAQQQQIAIAEKTVNVVKQENLPEMSTRVFSQRLYGLKDPYTGFSVNIAFPIFGNGAYKSRLKAAQTSVHLQEQELEYNKQQFDVQKVQLLLEVEKNTQLLDFYETEGLKQAENIINSALLSYQTGDISFADLNEYLTQTIQIKQRYIDALNLYNQSVIQYNYYNNK
ncbi:MAG TPA: CusA/CzcA family heavy metal efflux RND transporter [Chitinophagales bacterium]|nr:CusA/CzcA family heavy metal efflux RND transporter [Chitinophagales bacterium]